MHGHDTESITSQRQEGQDRGPGDESTSIGIASCCARPSSCNSRFALMHTFGAKLPPRTHLPASSALNKRQSVHVRAESGRAVSMQGRHTYEPEERAQSNSNR